METIWVNKIRDILPTTNYTEFYRKVDLIDPHCPIFQNGTHPLKCFILVLILLSLCQKGPPEPKKLLHNCLFI